MLIFIIYIFAVRLGIILHLETKYGIINSIIVDEFNRELEVSPNLLSLPSVQK